MTEEISKNDSIEITTTTTTNNIPTLNSLLLLTAKNLKENSNLVNTSNNLALVESPEILLNSESSNESLKNLLNLNLKELNFLPLNLNNLILNFDLELTNLSYLKYKSFLLNHKSNLNIKKSFNNLNLNLNNFLLSTKELNLISNKFNSNLNKLKLKRNKILKLKERLEEIEDLLELSKIVENCVKIGFWSESLEISLKLNELINKLTFESNNTTTNTNSEGRKGALILLNRVKNEVKLALLSLRAKVLESLLQRELKLPGAVRGISILRRMSDNGLGLGIHQNQNQSTTNSTTDSTTTNEFISKENSTIVNDNGLGEDALRIVFLAARWRCLREELDLVEGQMAASGIKFTSLENSTILKSVGEGGGDLIGIEENEERTRWIKRWIEVWREVVGETIGMYNEVFLTTSHLTTNSTSSPSTTTTLKQSHLLTAISPLTSFLTTSLNSLTKILTITIKSISNSISLSSILTQLSYCSHSFTRFGFEFREIEFIREKIEFRLGEIVLNEWNLAGKEFEKEFNEGSGKSFNSNSGSTSTSKDKKSLEDWLVRSESLSILLNTPLPSLPSLPSQSEKFNHLPPTSISLLPPLTRYLNSHINTLNNLRLLPPISLFKSLLLQQDFVLEEVTEAFLVFIEVYMGKIEGSLSRLESLEQEGAGQGGEGENSLSPEEARLKTNLKKEKKILLFTLLSFSRWLLPFLENGLTIGIYSDLLSIDCYRKINDLVEVNRRKRRDRIEEVWRKLDGENSK